MYDRSEVGQLVMKKVTEACVLGNRSPDVFVYVCFVSYTDRQADRQIYDWLHLFLHH